MFVARPKSNKMLCTLVCFKEPSHLGDFHRYASTVASRSVRNNSPTGHSRQSIVPPLFLCVKSCIYCQWSRPENKCIQYPWTFHVMSFNNIVN